MPDATIDWPAALEQHQRWMRTVIMSRIGDSHGAEDVLQEVAVAVLTQNSRPTDPCKVAPWLYRVAVRQTINFRRGRQRRRRLLENFANRRPDDDDAASDPRGWVLDEEDRDRVGAAMQRLPPQEREILLLKYTQGWTYQDLANHLGVSFKTIEYRIVKAKTALRRELIRFGYSN